MKLITDLPTRYATMRAHSATHLLHAQIATIIPTTKQAGSRVGKDELRFDFTTDRLLTDKEITTIQQQVNEHITNALPVNTVIMDQKTAINQGAKAFFEDTYGDQVRVVSMGEVSQELCGGTHVSNTSQIGSFAIIKQEAVAAGIKRISAVTGPKVATYLNQQQGLLQKLTDQVGVKSVSQLLVKIQKIQDEYKQSQSLITSLETKVLQQSFTTLSMTSNQIFSHIVAIDPKTELATIPFKTIVQQAKIYFAKNNPDDQVLLYANEGNFAIFSFGSTSAKDLMTQRGGNGGGNDDMVQGKVKNIQELM